MKKLQIALLILVLVGLFAFADYMVSVPEGMKLPSIPSKTTGDSEEGMEAVSHPNITEEILAVLGSTHKIEQRSRSTELFELFDLRSVSSIAAYRNVVIEAPAGGGKVPIQVYEIHGPAGQGRVTYLNIKLAIIEQLGGETGINETGTYGYNSLFYNDSSNPSTGFLITQIGDMVWGFSYSKEDAVSFDFIKTMIDTRMSMVSSTS